MGLYAWFCRRSCWRACRSGWFSIFRIHSRTLVFCACFTSECGNPGIRKSRFTSCSIVCSWLSWPTTGLSVLSRSVLSPTLNVSLSWQERVWELFGTFSVFQQRVSSFFHVLFQRWDPYCLQMNVLGLQSFRVSPFFLKKHSWKVQTSISRERDVFLPSCTVLVSSLRTSLTVLSRFGLRIGWLPNFWSLSIFWTQFSLTTRVLRRSLVEAKVTCILFRIWLLQFSS